MDPVPERFNMARYCVRRAAERFPDKVALIVDHGDGHDALTFGQLDDAVRRTAGGMLAAGLRPGDRVLLRTGNTALTPISFFGAIAAGIVALPVSSALTEDELAFLREDAQARVLDLATATAWSRYQPQPDYLDTAADDPAFMVYTSGTTGRPKGVVHAQRSAWGRRPMYQGWYGIGSDDVMLHAGALNWTYTLGVGLTDPWANGATAVIYNGPPDRSVWPRLIQRYGATLFAAVPGVYRQLLDAGDFPAMDTLRHGLVAGEALIPSLLQRWAAATGLELYEALGMSEISTFISSGPDTPARPGSPGRPQAGRRVVALSPTGGTDPLPVGEQGLLAVHRDDPGLMLGYWKRPEDNPFRGDWFVTADLVHFDEDGYVHHHGRIDDVMTAGGFRVAPAEVENCLRRHPAVEEVAVTEVAVKAGVSVIAAFAVLREPRPPNSTDDDLSNQIIGFAREHLAGYKVPRMVRFVRALPRTANGKLRRRDLTESAERPPGIPGASGGRIR